MNRSTHQRCLAHQVPESKKKSLNCRLHWIGRATVFIICIAMISIAGLQAQTGQGALNGRVTDGNGAVIQKAHVVIVNDATQVSLSTVTNSDGLYTVQSLNLRIPVEVVR
ncbi:MAG: carboxypeptidase-like regulatory domain-containing protein [Terracidiphilus sp.]|nr:carboxypeptidase-like regulatory domain-containing protein [Terracidiphilus sp.]